jgi:hypothetical protein
MVIFLLFLILVVLLAMAGFFTATGKFVLNIIPLVIAIIAWDKIEEALKPTGITMIQFIGWSVFILVILGAVTYKSLAEIVKKQEEQKRSQRQFEHDKKYSKEIEYAREKNLYIRTGKVSNWDQEGRTLFNFEVKESPCYIRPPTSSLSNTNANKASNREGTMALIDCPKCSKKISKMAASCPNCGVSLNQEKRSDLGNQKDISLYDKVYSDYEELTSRENSTQNRYQNGEIDLEQCVQEQMDLSDNFLKDKSDEYINIYFALKQKEIDEMTEESQRLEKEADLLERELCHQGIETGEKLSNSEMIGGSQRGAQSKESFADKIRSLNDLHKEGLLTEEEYLTAKNKLLENL